MKPRAAAGLLGLVIAACSTQPPVPPATPQTAVPTPAKSSPATGLLPDGAWQVELSEEELAAAGARPGALPAGVYTWTFDGKRARIRVTHDGSSGDCFAEASETSGGVRLTYLANLGCGGWTDTIGWEIHADGLHLTLVDSSAPREDNAPYLEAKPWQPVEPEPIPAWPEWSVRCEPGCQGPISASTFVSSGFMPGLSLAFPQGDWFNSRDDQDEIEFDVNRTALRIWRNPRPINTAGQPVTSVGDGVAGLARWFVRNPRMEVSRPRTIRLADSVAATSFTMRVSPTYASLGRDCPAHSCLDVLWINDGHVFGVDSDSAERFYLVPLANSDVLVISLDAPDLRTLNELDPKVADILRTLQLPEAS